MTKKSNKTRTQPLSNYRELLAQPTLTEKRLINLKEIRGFRRGLDFRI